LRDNSLERSTRRARVPDTFAFRLRTWSPLKSLRKLLGHSREYSRIFSPRYASLSQNHFLDAPRKPTRYYIRVRRKSDKEKGEILSWVHRDKSSLSKSGPRVATPCSPPVPSSGLPRLCSLPPHVQRRTCATSDAYAPADPPGFPSAPCSSPLPGLVRRAY